jgi:Transposase DDE domain
MVILERVLHESGIRKTQSAFIGLLFSLWLAIPGRINYANLARFSDKSEKTFRNWFVKPFEFMAVTSSLVTQLQQAERMGTRLVLAIDASFISKSGDQTPGLAKYWESKQGKAVKGLEVSCCAVIDVPGHQAIPLDALQTPSELSEGQSRLDHYAAQLTQVLNQMPTALNEQIAYVVGDGYYTKKGFIRAVRKTEKHFVGKLRCDANLRYLYQGNPTGKAGRPKLYEGKVDFKNFAKWQLISTTPDTKKKSITSIYTQVVYAVAFHCAIRVVCVRTVSQGNNRNRERYELFFSTDTQQDALDILTVYQARFHIEFCFRDAKQFSGLSHCQSRQPRAIDFHWQMAFLAVSLARAEQLLRHQAPLDSFVFSMEDAKRRAYNEFFANKIFRFLPFQQTLANYPHLLEPLLNLGVKAA